MKWEDAFIHNKLYSFFILTHSLRSDSSSITPIVSPPFGSMRSVSSKSNACWSNFWESSSWISSYVTHDENGLSSSQLETFASARADRQSTCHSYHRCSPHCHCPSHFPLTSSLSPIKYLRSKHRANNSPSCHSGHCSAFAWSILICDSGCFCGCGERKVLSFEFCSYSYHCSIPCKNRKCTMQNRLRLRVRLLTKISYHSFPKRSSPEYKYH